VVASCLAKPSCYTWSARRYYSSCCPAWQLVSMHCIHWCIGLFSCKAASVFSKFTLLTDTLPCCSITCHANAFWKSGLNPLLQ